MRKSIRVLSALAFSYISFFSTIASAVESTNTNEKETTRNNAVIFKVHDIKPIENEGIVSGCDFTVTLYNRTSINFRSFTINLEWKDLVADNFKFDKYMETILNADELAQQKQFSAKEKADEPMQTSISINAFGTDKQLSVRSHIDSEKCYLLLSEAQYNVSPCDIARSLDTAKGAGLDNKECTSLFQFVDTGNPEYYGQFKKLSATELALQAKKIETGELSDIDAVIGKIVENLGSSNKTLTNIN